MISFSMGCGQLDVDLSTDTSEAIATNFLLSNDMPWIVDITRVRSISDSLFYNEISDPIITISFNDLVHDDFVRIKKDVEFIPSYIHKGSVPSIPAGSICKLNISSIDFPDVEAIDTMPALPQVLSSEIRNIETTKFSNPLFTNHFLLSAFLELKFGKSENDNFYIVQSVLTNDLIDLNPGFLSAGIPKEYADSIYTSEASIRYEGLASDIRVIDLDLFDNEEPTIMIDISGRYLSKSGSTTLILNILKVSRTYSDYIQRSFHTLGTNTDIFSEPIEAFFNIENGFGIFALANSQTTIIEVD